MLEAIVNRLAADDGVRIIATVGDGQALVEAYAALLAAGEPPDLVLCDYSMPGLNGIEALRAILDKHPQARVLILSAYDDQALVVAAMAAGAAGYLLKSIPPDEQGEKGNRCHARCVGPPRLAACGGTNGRPRHAGAGTQSPRG